MFKVGDSVQVILPIQSNMPFYYNGLCGVITEKSRYYRVYFYTPAILKKGAIERQCLFEECELIPWPPTDFMEYMKIMLLKGGQNGQT